MSTADSEKPGSLGSFERAALKILGERPWALAEAKTFAAIEALLREHDWQGACHATTAIAFTLLREQGVSATPCLGEIMIGNIASDHSWVEIDGEAFDVAISRPIPPGPILPCVIAGHWLNDGEPATVRYGAVSGQPMMLDAATIARRTIGAYMSGFPGSPNGLWEIAREVGDAIGLAVHPRDLIARYTNAR